jgi:hypothetical protein
MPTLSQNLALGRCPHCSIANPLLNRNHHFDSNNHSNTSPRKWAVYICGTCGGVVSAWASNHGAEVAEYFPVAPQVDQQLPDRPRTYLQQAQNSLHAPAGAVMLAASAVDSMLKLKGFVEGSLYSRIQQAAADHVITNDMAAWAHEVRLDANDQRHADDAVALPSEDDAKRILDFANALAEIMFVLPSRVQRALLPKG